MLPPLQFKAMMLTQLLADPMWNLLPNVTPSSALQWLFAKARLGLPNFLQRWPSSAGRKVAGPRLFGFVKSKCFQDSGEHSCQKPGHSCLRRVIDMSAVPHSRGWKILARAARGVVASVAGGHELFNPSDLAHAVRGLLQPLCPSRQGMCMGCGCVLSPGLQVVSADIDQAFEACSSSGVGQAWLQVAKQFQHQFGGDNILVRKGKKLFTKLGARSYGRGWWALTLDQIHRGLVAATACSMVIVGHLNFGMVGISIGGTMSGAAVSVHLAAEENSGKHRLAQSSLLPFPADQFPSFINWIRYVDDLLAASLCYCPSCILVCLRSVFAENHIIMLQLSCLD